MADIRNLEQLWLDQLRDLYDAEVQLSEALPEMAKHATSSSLKFALHEHWNITQQHMKRLDDIFEMLAIPPVKERCRSMQGLIADASRYLTQDYEPTILDAVLLDSAKKISHYKIAGYGSACAMASLVGRPLIAERLSASLQAEQKEETCVSLIGDPISTEPIAFYNVRPPEPFPPPTRPTGSPKESGSGKPGKGDPEAL